MNWWTNVPWKRRARRKAMEIGWEAVGLTRDDVDRLAEYNAERMRGIVHNPEYVDKMRKLQGKYHRWLRSING
jgi:hypothetical protein